MPPQTSHNKLSFILLEHIGNKAGFRQHPNGYSNVIQLILGYFKEKLSRNTGFGELSRTVDLLRLIS